MKEQSKVLEALAPVAKNLDTLQNKVTQIEEGRKREMGALGAQLKGLNDQQARLDKETSSLSAALRNNKVRGPGGGHGCRWAYVAPGYDRASAGRQDHSD